MSEGTPQMMDDEGQPNGEPVDPTTTGPGGEDTGVSCGAAAIETPVDEGEGDGEGEPDPEPEAEAELETEGEDEDEEGPDDEVEVLICGQCDAKLPDGAEFCPQCGTPVAEGDEDEPELDLCGYCEMEIQPGDKYCWFCGMEIDWNGEEHDEEEQTISVTLPQAPPGSALLITKVTHTFVHDPQAVDDALIAGAMAED